MGQVDYRVLGALRAGAEPSVLRGQRGRDVLALLLLRRGRPLAPELILDAVWESEAVRLDSSVVHTVIARLRRALGHDAITRHDTGYQLRPDATVDSDEFTRLIRAARSLVPERRGEIVDLLHQALALWSGPEAYAGVSEALVATDRPRLHELRDTAIEQLAERLLAGGSLAEIADSVALTSELTTREPLREHAHELLMEGSYRLGRQGDALAAYTRLRHALRDELGIDPSPTTAALYARILAQDSEIAPVSRDRASRGGAPRPRTPTIGRDGELAALARQLDSGRRLLTITGPGGVGKSRLLAEFAAHLPRDATSVYAELPAREDASAEEVAEAIARGAGLTLGGGDPVAALVRALRGSDHLLLLDEAEWSLAGARAVIDAVMNACPRVRIVLTSRAPLELVGETRLVLGPLTTPAPGASGADLAASPAVRLFVERLSDHAPELSLSPSEYARAAEIARRVDGLPLALELVAGQAVSSSVEELLHLVEAPLDIAAAERDRELRQRSLRETLTWSVARLSPSAQTVLARLGVFAGAFDVAAATAIVGPLPGGPPELAAPDVPALVRGLIRESQVQVDRRGATVRMRLLRTVGELARETLRESGDADATSQRHRAWFAARWRDQPLTDALILDVATAYADYVAALRSSLAARDGETAGDLAITLGRYWFFVETGGEGIRHIREVLASGLLSTRQEAILRLLEVALMPQDQGVEQRAALDHLIGPLRDEPDWLGRLHILRSVGPYVHGDFAGALASAQEAVGVARDRAAHHLPEALGAEAVMLAACGRLTAAVAVAQEAWSLIAAGPSAVDLTQVVPKVALALMDSDHPREALVILERTLGQVEEQLGIGPTSLFTINAGWAALGCDAPEAGLRWFARSLDHLDGGGDLLVTGEVLSGAGAALAAVGDPGATEVLAAADGHLRGAGAVLSPWQQRVVDRLRGPLDGHATPTLAPLDLSHATRLIRAAVAR